MILLLLPLAATFEVRNINLTVVDNDHSSFSRRLIGKIVSSGYFKLTHAVSDSESALKTVELDSSDIILEIPGMFERDLVRDGQGTLLILVNSVNGTKGHIGSSYVTGIIRAFSADIRVERMNSGRPVTPVFSVVPRYRFNPLLEYPVFMVPALMVMLLTMLCGFLPALNIVGEKEKGTLEQMNVTPVRKFTLILSKLIPYWVIGFVVLSLGFGISWIVYDLIPAGNLFTIYFFATVYILAISGFGLVISNYAKTIQQAMFMMFFFVITFILMSGLYTPVNSMPAWAQCISDFIVLKYMIEVFRLVYLKGSGIADLAAHFYILCGFAVFFNAWAVFSYRKTM